MIDGRRTLCHRLLPLAVSGLLLAAAPGSAASRHQARHPRHSIPQVLEIGTPDSSLPTGTATLQGPFGKARQVTYHVVGGHALFQGDIDLGSVDAKGNLLPRPSRRPPVVTAVGITDPNLVWPGCVVPWEFDGVPLAMQVRIKVALSVWASQSPCTFPAHTTEADFLVFRINMDDTNKASHSAIGRQGGGQEVSIYYGATNSFTIVHEIGHALGLFHEHSRHDRNLFVTVNTANIRSGFADEFAIDKNSQDLGLYNFNSVMHYPATAFAKPGAGPTLVSKVPGAAFGQRAFLDDGDVSGALEVQGIDQGWTVFQPQKGPGLPSSPTIGPNQEEIYYQTRVSGGRDFGLLCRRHNFAAPLSPDCMAALPPEPLGEIPAATFTPGGKLEASIFVRGVDTGRYLHFRRDYAADAAGGAFRLEPAPAGTNWFSGPAALTLDSRILVFGVRGRVDHPGETALHMIFKDYGDGTNAHPWSTPIELPLPAGAVPDFEPAVVSTRPGIWTLFTFDLLDNLWAAEGDRDGKIVTAWTQISTLERNGFGPEFGPAVAITQVPGADFLLLATGPDGHLVYSSADKLLHATGPWRDVGGLLTGRPAAATFSSGTLVGVLANIQDEFFWFREWDPSSHVVKGGF
jgi:hypothetical protein